MSQSFRSRLKEWKIDRRQFLYATGGLAGLVATTPLQALTEKVTPSFSTNPFTLGVASGDPLADSVMLWTRLAVEPLAADGGGGVDPVRVPVHWYVATDDRMRHVVRRGVTVADPDFAHSVHVDVDGLAPGRWYWYQFQVRGEWSPIGRTRTLVPHWDSPHRIRFAFASCQHFEMGFYNAYQHMAQENLDLVLFLGDYIYEDGVSPTLPRQHDGPEPMTVGAYRNRHAIYKGDANVHAHYAAELKANFDDPASETIGTEFVGTSITSGGDGVDVPANAVTLLAENPHIKFVNTQRGYVVCDVTRRRWRSEYKVVPFVSTPGAPITTRTTFTVQGDEPGLHEE